LWCSSPFCSACFTWDLSATLRGYRSAFTALARNAPTATAVQLPSCAMKTSRVAFMPVSACLDVAGCNALDFYNATNFCTLYPDGCNEPTASWDEASSYVLAQSCVLGNGTAGILIAGHCHIGIELPTTWNIVTMEVPELLCSPRSWACYLLVSFLYTYLRSPWLRMKMRPILNKGEGLVCPIAMRIAGSTWCKRIMLMIGNRCRQCGRGHRCCRGRSCSRGSRCRRCRVNGGGCNSG